MTNHRVGDRVVYKPDEYGDQYVGRVLEVHNTYIVVKYREVEGWWRTCHSVNPHHWVVQEPENPLEVY